MKSSFLVSILLLKERLRGMVILTTCNTYSNITKQALPWTKELSGLKQTVEEFEGVKFLFTELISQWKRWDGNKLNK
jgi:hypothetical protein